MHKEWNLDDLMTSEEFPKVLQEVESKLSIYEDWIGKLSPNVSEKVFNEYIDFDESIDLLLSRAYVFASLQQSKNEKDENAKFLLNKVRDLGVIVSEKSQKINNWIKGKEVEGMKALDDENARRLFKSVNNLEFILSYARKAAEHTLLENEENIISKFSVSGSAALSDLKSLIEAEFVYKFKPKDISEEKLINSQDELNKFRYSNNSNEREASYVALFDKYYEHKEKFFLFYQSVVKNWKNHIELRKYTSPISMRNFGNMISDEVINTLLEVCSENVDVFQNYFKYKAKKLGVEKLRRFDIYAPLEEISDKYPLEEGLKLVDYCFENFSSRFKEEAHKVISSNHLDTPPTLNKGSGAFCMTVSPDEIPFVLTNYTDDIKSVYTLAHELGHAVHGLYASKNRYASQHPPLPLAETASTFAELLLFEHLVATTTDKDKKEQLISDSLAGSYASIMRQSYFVLFEIKAHEMLTKGTKFEELSEVYLSLLKEQFGDSLELDASFKYEWMTIPHIFRTPFYCYAYSFGDLLTSALFALYKKEGKSFVPKIEKILEYGGSKDPQEILAEVGIDITKKEFWQGSFDLIKGWAKEIY